jgi:hypothetical protein
MLGFCIGVPAFSIGLWLRLKEARTQRWIPVEGTIVASRIDKKYVGKGGYEFVPVVEYKFPYEGQVIRSAHRRISNYASGRHEEADAILARYPAGSTVSVFVNPKNPADSVLERGSSALSWIPLILGLFFVLLSIWTLNSK